MNALDIAINLPSLWLPDSLSAAILDPIQLNEGGAVLANSVYFRAPDASAGAFVMLDAKIDVTYKNTIVKTPITGRRGTVKESICGDDYTIDMKGHLVSLAPNSQPLVPIVLFAECMKTAGCLQVASKTLLAYGITSIVLDNYTVEQIASPYVNAQPVKLKFFSDKNLELEIF